MKDGKMLGDFFIVKRRQAIHVCIAPSPGATASLEVGAYIVQLVKKQERGGSEFSS